MTKSRLAQCWTGLGSLLQRTPTMNGRITISNIEYCIEIIKLTHLPLGSPVDLWILQLQMRLRHQHVKHKTQPQSGSGCLISKVRGCI
ncbi:Uncharacterized protein HZ326_17160 [Fusarium oxysporum f. sp. albedinis]|nr:Uncharacterized protein HZ326_17160 [Fusarium oxysporum f. sp. albedinis]